MLRPVVMLTESNKVLAEGADTNGVLWVNREDWYKDDMMFVVVSDFEFNPSVESGNWYYNPSTEEFYEQ